LPVVGTLHELDKPALIQILTQPRNAITRQYQKLFEYENVKLRFTDDAMEAIAEMALDRKIGARGLRMIIEDLIKFGLIPEFVGRLPVVATLNELDKGALIEILKEPKNSLVRQYQTIMGFENVTLKFTDEALEAIAEEALKRNVGARGLKIIIEELMLDIMYTIPSQDAISECVITREVVDNRSQPITLYRKAG